MKDKKEKVEEQKEETFKIVPSVEELEKSDNYSIIKEIDGGIVEFVLCGEGDDEDPLVVGYNVHMDKNAQDTNPEELENLKKEAEEVKVHNQELEALVAQQQKEIEELKKAINEKDVKMAQLSVDLQNAKAAPSDIPQIKITREVRSQRVDGNVIGWCDAEVGGIKLYDLKLLKSTRAPGTFFLSQQKHKSRKDGKWYSSYHILSESTRKALENTATKAIMNLPAPQATAAPATEQSNDLAGAMDSTNKEKDMADFAKKLDAALFSSAAEIEGQKIQAKVPRDYPNVVLRMVIVDGVEYWQQNPERKYNGQYTANAIRARNGERIIQCYKNRTKVHMIVNGVFENVALKK